MNKIHLSRSTSETKKYNINIAWNNDYSLFRGRGSSQLWTLKTRAAIDPSSERETYGSDLRTYHAFTINSAIHKEHLAATSHLMLHLQKKPSSIFSSTPPLPSPPLLQVRSRWRICNSECRQIATQMIGYVQLQLQIAGWYLLKWVRNIPI